MRTVSFGEIPTTLDLNEHEISPVPCDDIDFSLPASEITLQNRKALSFQKLTGSFLIIRSYCSIIHVCPFRTYPELFS